MSADLDLIRGFRAQDGMVDATSQEDARAALLEHIAGSPAGKRAAHGRPPRRGVFVQIRADVIMLALATLAVVGVGAAFLSIGSRRPQPSARHAVLGATQPLVIQNFSSGKPPALPGRPVCTVRLSRPGVPPGGIFYPAVCQGQPTGGKGYPSGTFQANVNRVSGVNEYPFSITAAGLRPNTHGSVYAIWLSPAATNGGHVGTYRVLKPQTPRLLNVIEPGVARDGKLAVEGLLPHDLLNNNFLLRVTLQTNPSSTTPGRTVLRGFVSTTY